MYANRPNCNPRYPCAGSLRNFFAKGPTNGPFWHNRGDTGECVYVAILHCACSPFVEFARTRHLPDTAVIGCYTPAQHSKSIHRNALKTIAASLTEQTVHVKRCLVRNSDKNTGMLHGRGPFCPTLIPVVSRSLSSAHSILQISIKIPNS